MTSPMAERNYANQYWPKEKVESLIEEYRKRPVLWDSKQKIYFNRKLREKAYGELCAIVNESKENITKKINNLRSQYLQETKKVIRTRTCGGSDEDFYVSGWWAFNKLHFLKENSVFNENSEYESETASTYIIRLNQDIPSGEGSSEQAEVEIEEIYPAEIPSPVVIETKPDTEESSLILKKKRKRMSLTSNLNSVTHQKDVLDSYGKYLADEIRSIRDVHQQHLLKLKIQQLIYYAHKGWLQESDDT